jgi:hypothetical protein
MVYSTVSTVLKTFKRGTIPKTLKSSISVEWI